MKIVTWRYLFQRLVTLKAIALFLTFGTKLYLQNNFNDYVFCLMVVAILFIRTFEQVKIKTALFEIGGSDEHKDNSPVLESLKSEVLNVSEATKS